MHQSSHGSRFASHFLESVVLTWVSNFVRIAIGLVALRLVTGAIPEDALGAYWVLTSVSALLANLADLGVGLGAVRHLPIVPSPEQARRLMHTLILLRAAVLAVLCALIYVCRPWILQLFDAQVIADKYAYLYAFVIVTSLGELYTSFLQGLNRFRFIALVAFVSSLARLVLIVLFVRVLDMGIEGLFLSEVASLALAGLMSGLASGHGWKLGFDRAHGRQQMRFGLPLYANSLLSYSATRINTLMLGSMSGTTAVSYFMVAARIPEQLSTLLRGYVFVYLPNMSRLLQSNDPRAAQLLATSLRLLSYGFAMCSLALAFFRHEVLHLLAPAPYQVAAPAVTLLAAAMAFNALGAMLGNTLVATGDSRTPLKINVFVNVFGVAINLYCIQRWSFMGAAWAHLVFHVVGYAVTDVVVSRRIRSGAWSYLRMLTFLGLVLAAGLDAPLWGRLLALAVAGLGCFVLSPELRADVRWVWNARRARQVPGAAPGAEDPATIANRG